MQNTYKNFDWDVVGLNFGNWEEEKIWALDLPIESISRTELFWHLDIPYWENDDGDRWAVTPRDVLEERAGTGREYERMLKAENTYPIDIFFANGKWYVLDGLHRFAKLYLQGEKEVQVRKVPKERFHKIASDFPIKLPG